MSHVYYNPNPDGNRVGDCTVRALCKATGHDWDYVRAMLRAIRYADIIGYANPVRQNYRANDSALSFFV